MIAVLLPYYKNLHGLKKTLFSLEDAFINQKFDLFIVNDDPDIKLKNEIKSDISNFSFKIIFIDNIKNIGCPASLNIGINNILSNNLYNFIARIDAGDTVSPHRFLLQYKFMTDNPTVDIVGSFMNWVSENGNFIAKKKYPITELDIKNQLFITNAMAHPSIMIRCKCLINLSLFNPSYIPCADYEFFLRNVNLLKLRNIPLYLTNYEISKHQVTSKKKYKLRLTNLKIKLHYFTLSYRSLYGLLYDLVLIFIPRKIFFIKLLNFFIK